jgi:hypothetical protein
LFYDDKGATRASDHIGEMLMARGWYHNRQYEQRLLSIEEIAGACGINNSKVKEWISGHHLKRVRAGEDLLDAAEVITLSIAIGFRSLGLTAGMWKYCFRRGSAPALLSI